MSKEHGSAPEPGAVLSCRGLARRYGAVTALAGVDLDIHAGEVVAVVGDNGAGKSTLVKILSGAVQASEGAMYVDGAPVTIRDSHSSRDAGIETVYQDLALAPNISIAGNVFLGRELRRRGLARFFGLLDYRGMDRQARAELAHLKIRVPSVRTKCSDLSGGQRQAVAVARAAAWGSKVVILDEPTAALGVEEQHQVGELIKEIARKGMGVLLVSHNMNHVKELSDRVLVMFQGRLVANLKTSEITPQDMVMWITGAALTEQSSAVG